jgi:cytochrome c
MSSERLSGEGKKLFLLCGMVLSLVALCGCQSNEVERQAAAMTGGDPHRGEAAISRYGCSTCHVIPGIKGADALVGPPLTKMGSRSYVAGVLPNTPDNMIRWLENPPAVDHLTAMPNLGVTDQDARDMASYLYTLR